MALLLATCPLYFSRKKQIQKTHGLPVGGVRARLAHLSLFAYLVRPSQQAGECWSGREGRHSQGSHGCPV